MKTYTEEELADLVGKRIISEFDSPENIIAEFEKKLEGKVKSLSPRKLNDIELEDSVLKFAVDVHANMSTINKEIILTKLSKELLEKSSGKGIELSEHEQYFTDVASDVMKGLIKKRHADLKKKKKK
ncbi:MAG: hypothetical protein HRT72_09995 [Flavobacteriales bacterium]|nr:hypothetical protein [Flavobacteriales bacterium]